MQGWSPDFLSKLTRDAVAGEMIDQTVGVSGADAISCAIELARSEGIFCGITGGATLAAALQVAREAGATQIALLKCTSAYPSSPDEMNLRTIPELARRFEVPVGLSDHTMGIEVPVAAVALGATIIEKHLTLSRADKGPDSDFSLEPAEFKAMVDAVRTTERALGRVHFGVSPQESKSRIFRRSLFVVENMKRGDAFTAMNIRSIRPGHGLHTRYLPEIMGKHAACDIERGTPMSWDFVFEKKSNPSSAGPSQ